MREGPVRKLGGEEPETTWREKLARVFQISLSANCCQGSKHISQSFGFARQEDPEVAASYSASQIAPGSPHPTEVQAKIQQPKILTH